MKTIFAVCAFVAMTGCTVLNGITGLVTGPFDCTYWHVASSGPAGLILFPITPFEGAYRGAQVGWLADKAAFNGTNPGLSPLAHVLPCSTNAVVSAFGGEGLTWNTK